MVGLTVAPPPSGMQSGGKYNQSFPAPFRARQDKKLYWKLLQNASHPDEHNWCIKLDDLRAFTRASYRCIKSYCTKTRIGHNKNKLKNQDILAQEFRLDIYYSSCFVEYPPMNPIASSEFKPLWFKKAQLSTHLWRTCLQRIFQVFLQLISGDYIEHASRNCAKLVYWSWRSEWIVQLNIFAVLRS